MVSIRKNGKDNLLAMLEEAVSRFGYVPKDFIDETAKELGMSISDIYGVATFYSFLSVRPQGRNVIRICRSMPCFLKSSQTVMKSIERDTGIGPGETTPDGRFSFEMTNCIGACDKAPAMMINNQIHGDLTPGKISVILKSYK